MTVGRVDMDSDAPLWRRDEERFVDYRAKYLERATDLPEKKARVLALSELGYSTSGIAARVDHTAATADGYLDEIAVRFGPGAALAKDPADLGVDASIETVSKEDILDLPDETREQWLELAKEHAIHAPEWLGEFRRDVPAPEGGAP